MPRQMLPGSHHALGAHGDADGVNFALFSAHAKRVELCLFDPDGKREIARYTLPRCTNHIWHGYLPGLSIGAVYGYRVHGPYDPQNGHRFNHHKLLIDPYARKLLGGFAWSDTHFAYAKESPEHSMDEDLSFDERDNADFMPKCVVTAPAAHSASRPKKPRISWQETTLYETHVRGFTMLHPDVPELEKGTFAGLSHKKVIEYIKALGVSSVELLPVQQSIDEHFLHQKGLRNYWGYNTLNYFAPHAAYQARQEVAEFQQLVDCYHEAGLEVILDVVYNHTCESNHLGPTLSFRGIDNASYYRLQAQEPRYYVNDTGCGNTLNLQHPAVLRMVLDSLRYWSGDMGVDGFRFDLATTLGRKQRGFSANAGFFQAIAQDPELSEVKLIAEPWDIGPGGYQLGNFPGGWSEWNDSYRDTCRQYWRQEPGVLPTFARRIHGSSDIFEHSGRNPFASINFITSHDGFTLNDLVSYEQRHNEANSESNNDGHAHNISQNFGVEGPTDDAEITANRDQHMRNMLATLLLSQGVPMLQAGDELGRSQLGNNNAYCQDNELSWLHWLKPADESHILSPHGRFVARLIELTKYYPILRNHEFVHAPQTAQGVRLYWVNSDGFEMGLDQWAEHQNLFLGYLMIDAKAQASVLVLFNAQAQASSFPIQPSLPSETAGWYRLLDTAVADGLSTEQRYEVGQTVDIAPSSVTVLGSHPWGGARNQSPESQTNHNAALDAPEPESEADTTPD